ncbi:sensor histidine kinase [Frankia sp. AgB32]|uniref:sensor histidine kinase n=1 Tax=Frankia sp. AgB32 TaxID=631119 RepID=UPI0034D3E7EF
MTTRARDLLHRSRMLLDSSRAAAAHLLASPTTPSRATTSRAPAALRVPATPAAAAAATGPADTGQPTPRPGSASRPGSSQPRSGTKPESVVSTEVLSAICADIALRDLNLVDSLLSQLEGLEAREVDAERLAELYELDHLAARLRRNAENLRVLAGRDANDAVTEATPLVDVIRAAMSSISYYSRVTIGRVAPLGVVGFAAEDVGRLLAELLDNATKSSPPTAPVRVGVHLTEHGSALLRVEDEGIGLPPDRLHRINDRLRSAPVLDDDAVRHMGLAVVNRIATRHAMRTWLAPRHPHGTTASVLLPATLLCELPESSWSGTRTVATAPAVTSLTTAGTITTAGPRPPDPSRPVESTDVGLPRRRAVRPQAHPTAPSRPGANTPGPNHAGRNPQGPTLPTRTAGGLPRRVSRSLKDATGPHLVSPPSRSPAARGADHERLLADLEAFTQGEQAARDEQRGA